MTKQKNSSEEIKVFGLQFDKKELRKDPLSSVLIAILLSLKALNNRKVNEILRKFEVIIKDTNGKIYQF